MNFTTHIVDVYLNESRDASFGFDNDFAPAELRLAAQFGIRVWDKDPASYILSAIYQQLNIGGSAELEATDYTRTYRAAGNRSLSIGDVLVLDGQPYAVEKVGFAEVTRSAVREAVNAHTIANEPAFVRPATTTKGI